MKVLIQRVNAAQVSVDNEIISEIKRGLLVFVGVKPTDTMEEAIFLAEKVANLRLFPRENQEFDLSVIDAKFELLIVSQFTLYGGCDKGRRPDFFDAARPEIAEPLYESFVKLLKDKNIPVQTGKFGAHMVVSLQNDGPATFTLEKNHN
ncbi:MAG: D-aminoacyl-tRNA deacylase [Candidatus Gracilibacteria bacterium]